ncbi:peptidoglycan/LPS O-acetylase OafA/YrhL [Jatrophihabitans sp. GAS493]|uniref:acyltransferase family protein n=1 Tax=Jatrophihabitans sp. GAS493 TaxID=1907575 RepID=UPI000BB69C4B|nr:acyltransferase family protein [Jatrophihabitans sp. GAS493]SOD71578.1 peptidoglycan/LPS O-acetylase OafA/YrhL [Jatrophihabitans sp. GAS493]
MTPPSGSAFNTPSPGTLPETEGQDVDGQDVGGSSQTTATMTRSQEKRARAAKVHPTFRPDVEGMRAVAVALVVLYHCGVTAIPGGYVGVDVFFVISGFLITSLLVREFETGGRISISDFYARRFRRILPAATVVLIATVAASALFLPITRIASIAKDAIWTSVFMANFRFSATGTNYLSAAAPPSPLQHYWSLAVEEQFYFVWPLLLFMILKLGRGGKLHRVPTTLITAGLCVVSFLWCVSSTSSNATVAYFSPFTRAWELGIGALIAVSGVALASTRMAKWIPFVAGWIGIVMIGYAAVHFTAATPFPGKAAALPVIGTGLLIIGGQYRARGGANWILTFPLLQWVGKLSYGWYLWHWPILTIATERYPNLTVFEKLLLALAGLLLAFVSFHVIEGPVRRSVPLLKSAYLSIFCGLLAIATVIAFANAFLVMDNGRTTLARSQAAAAAKQVGTNTGTATANTVLADVKDAANDTKIPSPLTVPLLLVPSDKGPAYAEGCIANIESTTSKICKHLATSQSPTVVLFGDSHAAQWMPALENIATRTPINLYVITKQSCPVADIEVLNPTTKNNYPQCSQWRQWALGQIKALHPSLVVVGEHIEAQPNGAGDTSWQAGLQKSLTTLKSSADNVAVLSDVPAHAQPTAECLSQHGRDISKCGDSPANSILLQHEAANAATAQQVGVSYVDAVPWLCTTKICPAVIANTVTSFDGTHLSASYSTYLGTALGTALGLEGSATQAVAAVTKALAVKKLPAQAANEITAKNTGPQYAGNCLTDIGVATFSQVPECTMGNPAAKKTVVLFGDSHAWMWTPAFHSIGYMYGWKVVLVAEAACTTADTLIWSSQKNAPNTGCKQWHTAAMNYISKLHPDAVVVANEEQVALAVDGKQTTSGADSAVKAGLVKTLNELKVITPNVSLLGDIPVPDTNPSDCLPANANDIQKCSPPASEAVSQSDLARERDASSEAGVKFVDTTPWLCSTYCPTVITDHVAYVDKFHISSNFAISVTSALASSLELTGAK